MTLAETSDSNRKTLLVVDDAPENLDIMTSLLKDRFQVKAAINGRIALKIASQQRPDLILLDVMMPDMDGYEVCRQLKADPATAAIPVIFLTALDSVDDETRGLTLGAVDYIAKPLNPAILMARINTHLALDEVRRELAAQNQALVEAARMREDVERIMHHDLKAPLTNIISIPSVLRNAGELNDRQQDFLQKLEDTGWRMLNMINMSLVLLKIEYGTYQPDWQEASLLQLLKQVMDEQQQAFHRKQLRFVLTQSDAAADQLIRTEPLLLQNLFANLLKNACEAAPAGSELLIELSDTPQGLQLVFENPGEVPEAIRPRFFEKFVTAGKKQGTGLGTYSAQLMAGVLLIDLALDTSVAGRTRLLLTFRK
ncbi:hybrid sensor histidine kinase/response regulator [Marinospirillum alkaliphilum]|uniref:histidine kinase n=1 Tax=Marinospirillum alkaliphilum DSM 21637 TaxID=1122209 RepID=A0A1K1VXD0_9GAMM|nr:hybrid sensor histidine kinase/response regulator [Marinospirillum alkaliphilum]SFX29873.1 Histidine kinase-, DNA gyrase B-, and HSP90-like ATPase [Marinospirillum alkaliphilum DSM 21637]